MMFHAIAERKVRQTFQSLSGGDYEQSLEGLAPRFEHKFAGNHALGGSRYTADGFRAWFQRLYRLFPNLDFEVGSVTASGPPWDLTVVAEWIDRATPAGGGTYENRGVHVIRIAWGKLASIHAYLDTKVLADTLRVMADNGLAEAVAPPILDLPDAGAGHQRARRREIVRADGAGRRSNHAATTGAASTGAASTGASRLGAVAIGAFATGALAIGAIAIGRVAIGRLTLGRAYIRRLEIDELIVRRRSDDAYAPSDSVRIGSASPELHGPTEAAERRSIAQTGT